MSQSFNGGVQRLPNTTPYPQPGKSFPASVMREAGANYVGPAFKLTDAYHTFFVWGDFSGATVRLQLHAGFGKWFNYTAVDANTEKMANGVRFGNVEARWVVDGGDPDTVVNATIVG